MGVINVIGLGYIGLPTALILASKGYDVVGTDYNISLVNTLQHGYTTFKEKGLDDLFDEAIKKGIVFSHEYVKTNIYIISVPTPYEEKNKRINPSYLIEAINSVVAVCDEKTILVIESTISPGTMEKYVRPLITKKKVQLVHAPERILPGNMLYELQHNPRTIGADDKEVGEEIKKIYSSFCKVKITVTDIRTAEMTKVVENTFRDINIAFANELTKICHSANMDVYSIIEIANKHPRVNILKPGPGVGGHCISVDPWFLVGDYPGLANIILAARKINDSMPEYVLERIAEIMESNNIRDIKKIGLYGLTYKENVDDIRESPTLQMLESMRKHLAFGAKIYDPYVKKEIAANQVYSMEEFLSQIDLVVVMVAHQEIIENMEMLCGKTVLDTQHIITNENTYFL